MDNESKFSRITNDIAVRNEMDKEKKVKIAIFVIVTLRFSVFSKLLCIERRSDRSLNVNKMEMNNTPNMTDNKAMAALMEYI